MNLIVFLFLMQNILDGSLISLPSKSKQSNTFRPIAPKPDSTGLILELQNDENIIGKFKILNLKGINKYLIIYQFMIENIYIYLYFF